MFRGMPTIAVRPGRSSSAELIELERPGLAAVKGMPWYGRWRWGSTARTTNWTRAHTGRRHPARTCS